MPKKKKIESLTPEQEHKAHALPPGDYAVVIQREETDWGTRQGRRLKQRHPAVFQHRRVSYWKSKETHTKCRYNHNWSTRVKFVVRDEVRIYLDGREVIDTRTRKGRQIYQGRVETMRIRQGGRCCLEGYAPMCRGILAAAEATFEHEDGRGMGGSKRDDRIELPDGMPINGAAHMACNAWKGSRVIDYNRRLRTQVLQIGNGAA